MPAPANCRKNILDDARGIGQVDSATRPALTLLDHLRVPPDLIAVSVSYTHLTLPTSDLV